MDVHQIKAVIGNAGLLILKWLLLIQVIYLRLPQNTMYSTVSDRMLNFEMFNMFTSHTHHVCYVSITSIIQSGAPLTALFFYH